MEYKPNRYEEDACIFKCPNTLFDKIKLSWEIFKRLDQVEAGYTAVKKNRDGTYQITEEASMLRYNREI